MQRKYIYELTFVLVVICSSLLGIYFAKTYGLGFRSIVKGEQAVNFYVTNRIKGPVFNDFDSGSYLLSRIYPHQKVFIDARPEAYPKTFFEYQYIPMILDTQVFKQVAEKYSFNSILLTISNPDLANLFLALVKDDQWKLVYIDSDYAILVKQNASNQAIIDKYLLSESNAIVPKHVSFDQLAWLESRGEKGLWGYVNSKNSSIIEI